jgi:mRNA interferase RelE/StbE
MASYKLIWKDSARKELKSLPKKYIALVLEKVNALAQNPFPHGSKKLADSENNYRIRIGIYRVVYSVFRKILTIEIVRVKHRKDVYR